MRRFAVLLVLSALISIGCHRIHDEVVGSGKRVTQTRDVGSFSSISTQGAFEIEVVCQQAVSLQLEGDDNIVPLITTEVSNNVLHVKSTRGYSSGDPISIKIGVPNLEGLNVSGAGKIDIRNVKTDRFEIDCNGAPTIKVAGTTKVIDIDTSGAAKIDTHKLHAGRAIVDSKGVSKVDLAVADQLDVTITGPSSVTYEGDPQVNKNIRGPGKLEKKASEGA